MKLYLNYKLIPKYIWSRGKTSSIIHIILSHLDSTLSDHGIFRLYWRSWAKLSSEMYRSNQPYPYQIFKDKKKYNLKTIINLRGERHCSSFYLEKKYASKNNIKLINFPISSRDLPSSETIIKLNKIFDEIEYPALMHCKSGADRVGIASAIYLILKKNYSVSEAQKQLSLKHLHIKHAKTGILDYFFKTALIEKANRPKDFINWVKYKYDKQKIKNSFISNKAGNFLINFLLRRE